MVYQLFFLLILDVNASAESSPFTELKSSETFDDAKRECKDFQLPILQSEREYDEMYDWLKHDTTYSEHEKDIWIGLVMNRSTSAYEWLDGTVLDIVDWGADEPKPKSGTEERCVYMVSKESHDAKYFTGLCSTEKNFVCMNQGSYTIDRNFRSFTDASEKCLSHGGHLPVVMDTIGRQRLAEKVKQSGLEVWIGLFEKGACFEWINERTLLRLKWDGTPDGEFAHVHRKANLGFVEIHAEHDNNDEARRYFCQHKANKVEYLWLDHHYMWMADTAVMYFPPRMKMTVSKRTHCAVECSRDAGCFQYTLFSGTCITYGKSGYWNSVNIGVPLFRRIPRHRRVLEIRH